MFTLDRAVLASELALLSGAAEKKGTIPILSFMLIEIKRNKAKLTASDLDIFLLTEIDADGEDWSGCVPFRQLHDFIRLLDESVGPVSFAPEGSRIVAKAGRSKIKLPVESVDKFPQPEKAPTNVEVTIDGQWLIPALSSVVVSAADESARLQLAGVLLEQENGSLAVVATDQHRMSYSETPLECQPFKVFLPRASVRAIIKLDANEISLSFNESIAQITAGSRVLTTRLLVAQFPQWRGVLPKSPKYTIEAVTSEIQAAIRRASVTLDRHRVDGRNVSDAIRLRFSKEALTVETPETDRGYSEETVEVNSNMNGETVLVGFNKQYLDEAFTGIGNQTQIAFTDGNSQMRVKPLNSDSVVHVVMPCRI